MTTRIAASLALIAAMSIGCGKYGPPVRVRPEAEPPDRTAATAPGDRDDGSKEDSEQEEWRP